MTHMETDMTKKLTRRKIIFQGALYGGTLWLLGGAPRPLTARAAEESEAPAVLTAAEWETVEAITGRIIPTDHEPGAIEANCVNFIDKALLHEDTDLRPTYEEGIRGLDAVSRHRFGKRFGVESLGIVPCGDQQRGGDLESDACPGKELGTDASCKS